MCISAGTRLSHAKRPRPRRKEKPAAVGGPNKRIYRLERSLLRRPTTEPGKHREPDYEATADPHIWAPERLSQDFSISSRLRPLVSGTRKMTKRSPRALKPA